MARTAQSERDLSFTDARGPAGPIASEGKSGAAALASGPIYEAGPQFYEAGPQSEKPPVHAYGLSLHPPTYVYRMMLTYVPSGDSVAVMVSSGLWTFW
jgi:hypothetical protein